VTDFGQRLRFSTDFGWKFRQNFENLKQKKFMLIVIILDNFAVAIRLSLESGNSIQLHNKFMGQKITSLIRGHWKRT